MMTSFSYLFQNVNLHKICYNGASSTIYDYCKMLYNNLGIDERPPCKITLQPISTVLASFVLIPRTHR